MLVNHQLMAEEVEIDPLRAGTALGTAEHLPIEMTRGSEVVDGDGEVEWIDLHGEDELVERGRTQPQRLRNGCATRAAVAKHCRETLDNVSGVSRVLIPNRLNGAPVGAGLQRLLAISDVVRARSDQQFLHGIALCAASETNEGIKP